MKIKAFTTILLMLFLASMITMAFTAPVAATPDSDIVGLWRFDEGSGSTAYDSSGYDNHGTLKGLNIHPEWVDGKFGKALSFDGKGDYVSIPDSDSLDTSEMTVMAWIKPSAWQSVWNNIVTKWFNPEDYDFHFSIRFDGIGRRLNLVLTNVSMKYGNTYLETGKWYHVAFTLNAAGDIRFYLGGSPDGEHLGTAGKKFSSTSKVQIGDHRGGYGLIGIIDEVCIWNIALTADEMASYNLGELKAEISGLSDIDGVDLKKPAVQRKKLLCNKINEVIDQIEAGKYEGAMDKLAKDVKPKLDYYDLDTWLAVEHPELVAKIDLIISLLRALI